MIPVNFLSTIPLTPPCTCTRFVFPYFSPSPGVTTSSQVAITLAKLFSGEPGPGVPGSSAVVTTALEPGVVTGQHLALDRVGQTEHWGESRFQTPEPDFKFSTYLLLQCSSFGPNFGQRLSQ